MSSQKQIAANRQNAQKSTGPKTEEGKSASSQNALKHGLTARQDVIAAESQELYDFRRDQMFADLAPTGPIEAMLAERIVSLSWRLDRSVTIQTQVIDTLLEDFERVHKEAVKDYDPYYPSRQNPDLKLGGAARNDIRDNKVLDRLLMYERRIERSLYKTMAELKNLQQTRKRNQPRTTEEDSTIQQSKEFILDTDPGPQRLGKEPTRTHITETSHTQDQMQNTQNKANLPEPCATFTPSSRKHERTSEKEQSIKPPQTNQDQIAQNNMSRSTKKTNVKIEDMGNMHKTALLAAGLSPQ